MFDPTDRHPFKLGLDRLIGSAPKPITPATEAEADAVFRHAEASKPLPTGYIVKADIRCNQLDTFRLVACDWQKHIEARRESIQLLARLHLGNHLIHAHPYLSASQRALLLRVTAFNFRDFGR